MSENEKEDDEAPDPLLDQEAYEAWRDDGVVPHGVKAAYFAGLAEARRRLSYAVELATGPKDLNDER